MTNDQAHPVIPLESEGVQPGFDIVLRGYDRGQVDRQIGWLEEQLQTTDSQLHALTEALRSAEHDSVEARRQAENAAAALERGRPSFEALGERIGTILKLAEEEAEALRKSGQDSVAQARSQWAQELAAAQRSMQQERRSAEEQAAAILAEAREQAQRLVTDARRSAAETTSAAQRQVEAMSRQRDAIHTELLRVKERFAAVLGGTIDVTEQRPDAAERPDGDGERTTVVTAAGIDVPPAERPADDPATARTQPMTTESAGR